MSKNPRLEMGGSEELWGDGSVLVCKHEDRVWIPRTQALGDPEELCPGLLVKLATPLRKAENGKRPRELLELGQNLHEGVEGGGSICPACLLSWSVSSWVKFSVPASKYTQRYSRANKGVPP